MQWCGWVGGLRECRPANVWLGPLQSPIRIVRFWEAHWTHRAPLSLKTVQIKSHDHSFSCKLQPTTFPLEQLTPWNLLLCGWLEGPAGLAREWWTWRQHWVLSIMRSLQFQGKWYFLTLPEFIGINASRVNLVIHSMTFNLNDDNSYNVSIGWSR